MRGGLRSTSFKDGDSHPRWNGGRYVGHGYVFLLRPDHPFANSRGYVREHILIVEAAIGHFLRRTAPVHHVNEKRADNSRGNLVACEDSQYHWLLHLRTRALDATGNPNLRHCTFCKKWDAPEYLTARNRSFKHPECHRRYMREWHEKHPYMAKWLAPEGMQS